MRSSFERTDSASTQTDLVNQRICGVKICDGHLRDCFLNNVAVNREVVEEYEKSRLGSLET